MIGRGFSRRRRRSSRSHSPPVRTPRRSVPAESRAISFLPAGSARPAGGPPPRPASRISAWTSRSSSSSRSEKSRRASASRSLHTRRASGRGGVSSFPASGDPESGRNVAGVTFGTRRRRTMPGSRARDQRSGGVSQNSAKAASKSARSSRRWTSSARAAAWNCSRRKMSTRVSASARSSIRACDTGRPRPRRRRPKRVRFRSSGGTVERASGADRGAGLTASTPRPGRGPTARARPARSPDRRGT